MAEHDDEREIEADTPIGKFRARGYDTLTAVVIVALMGYGYMLWMHMSEARASSDEVAKQLREIVRVQKFSTCLQATPDNQKEAQYSSPQSFCNRMAQ